ncbi:hypothetical protein [Streptomyces canus]|uniref:hypothetical protein n=1 Tax=Streptomyces canus TaxID=58343 RepID=UPI002E25EC06
MVMGFDVPVLAHRSGELSVGRGERVVAGDGIDVLDLDLPAVQIASAAGDLDRLGGVREPQPARDLDGFEAADLITAVPLLPGGVAEGDLVPGQRLKEVLQLLSFTIAM